MHSAHCTLFLQTVHRTKPCTLNAAQCTLNTAQCTPQTSQHNVHSTLHYVMNTKHCILHTSHCLQHIVHYNCKFHFLQVTGEGYCFPCGDKKNPTLVPTLLQTRPQWWMMFVCTLYNHDIQNKASERFLHCLWKTKKNGLPADAMNPSKTCLGMSLFFWGETK